MTSGEHASADFGKSVDLSCRSAGSCDAANQVRSYTPARSLSDKSLGRVSMCWAWWPADFARVVMLPFLPLGSTGTGSMTSSRTHPLAVQTPGQEEMDRKRFGRNRFRGADPRTAAISTRTPHYP